MNPPYFQNVINDIEENEIECDFVVVGTGAGGGPMAKSLAEKGFGVLIVEEGKYWTRKDFTGRPLHAFQNFYRNKGMIFAIGNAIINIPMGRMVGGSTAINTGTCWRTPEWILKKWVSMGLTSLPPEKMEKYFEKVEKTIRVEVAKDRVIGGIKKIIEKGAYVLSHGPLRRNAPDCDAQSVCDFGCPQDARLSVDITYIPSALRAGAMLLTETKAEKIIVKDGRAVGLISTTKGGKKIKIIANKGVIISCGAIPTPVFLLQNGLKNRNIGRNLTIHPAVTVGGFFHEDISPHKYAPQAYYIDEFHKEGILLLGSGLTLEVGAVAIPLIGEKFSEIMSEYEKTGWFGVMVEDNPSGRVVPLKGRSVIFYLLGKRETELLKKGIKIMSEIFFNCGAKMVFPPIRGIDFIKNKSELEIIDSASPMKFRQIVGFHLLGTARMGIDPKNSVVNENYETWEIRNLFIVDGSIVPTAIGVNPQETIMALSERAGEVIAQR